MCQSTQKGGRFCVTMPLIGCYVLLETPFKHSSLVIGQDWHGNKIRAQCNSVTFLSPSSSWALYRLASANKRARLLVGDWCVCLCGHLSAFSSPDIRRITRHSLTTVFFSSLVVTQQYKTEVALVKVRQIFLPCKTVPAHPKWLLLASKLKY